MILKLLRGFLSERARIQEISRLCETHNLGKSFQNRLVEEGITVSESKGKILQELERKQNDTHISQIKMTRDEEQTKREQVQAALEFRMGGMLSVDAVPYKDKPILELVKSLSNDRTMTDHQAATRAMQSTSDFPQILEAAINKTLVSNYENMQSRQNFWDMTGVSEVDNFKEFSRYQVSAMPNLVEQDENEPVTYGNLSETSTQGAIKTFAKGIGFSRKMLINDDLSAFSNISSAWAGSIVRLENKLFWDHFNNNTKIKYGNGKEHALFSTEHGNVSETSEKLSIPAISKARVKMMRQKSFGQRFELNLVPDLLIVAPELEAEAFKLISREMNPTNVKDINPYKGAFKIIVSPYLTNTKSWYLACSKGAFAPAFEAVYLRGQKIHTAMTTDFDNDCLKYKVRTDCMIVPVEAKALMKNNGGN